MYTNRAMADQLRSLAFGSISSSYAPVGPPLEFPTRLICFTNNTDADVIFTMDGSTDQIIVVSKGFKLLDITTNHRPINQDDFCFSIGIQWSVRSLTSPTTGSVYIEVIYAQPNS